MLYAGSPVNANKRSCSSTVRKPIDRFHVTSQLFPPPVSRKVLADLLSLSLKACGLDSTRYKGQSFRIGAASFAAERLGLGLGLVRVS